MTHFPAPTPFRPSSTIFATALLLAALTLAAPASAQTQLPTFAKSFTPATIGPGSISTLRFTIANPSLAGVSGLTFTDNLPAGVTIATPAQASLAGCGSGATLSAPEGGSTISFSGGTLAGGASCTIRVDVTSATAGTHVNTTGDLTSSAGNSGPATANLVVATDRPGFTKSFSPQVVAFGGRSTLTFAIDNAANGTAMIELAFTDNLPFGVVVAGPANVTNTCTFSVFTGGIVTALPGSSAISLSLGSGTNVAAVGAGGSCAISVDVIGNNVGTPGNTTGDLTSRPSGSSTTRSSGKAGAVLTVTTADLTLAKTFTDDPAAPGGSVNLRFTLTNRNRGFDATDITFSDDLDAALSGLEATGLPLTDPCGAGSELDGTGVITLTGGNLAAGASCTFDVTLSVPSTAASGSYLNTTGQVTGEVDGNPVVGNPASDTLFVSPAPLLTKTFLDDPVAAGGTTELEFTITNTSQTASVTDVTFEDVFAEELPTATGVPSSGFCGAGSIAVFTPLNAGNNTPASLAVSGASLGPGDSCTFSIVLGVAARAANNVYVNTTSAITGTVDGKTETGVPATDTLTIVASPVLVKEFTDDPAAPGGTVTLEFTLSHDEDAEGDATGITFTDDLGATLAGLAASALPADGFCGPGSTLTGTTVLTMAGGTLAPGESCTFSATLDVPAAAAPGSYTNTTSSVVASVLTLATTGPGATDKLRIAGLTLTKEFTDDPALPGGTVTLAFTIANSASAPTATDITFQDDLDEVIDNLAATGLPLTNICGGGSLAGTAGNTFLTFSGGSLLAGESCTFSVVLQIPASAEDDTYPNRTSNFRATVSGSTVDFDDASDELIIVSDFLALAKEFIDDPVSPGDSVTLRFTLSNQSTTDTIAGIAFTDDLDAVLADLAATDLPKTVCGGTASGTSTISFSGGSLAANASCSFDVTLAVPGNAAAGTAVNTTSEVTGSIGASPVTGGPASDTLVIDAVVFTKTFDDVAEPGGTVAVTFNIQNLSAVTTLTDLSFTDDLDAVLSGLVATALPAFDVCGVNSMLSGASQITLSGGNLLPGGSCTFSVTLAVPAGALPGDYGNITSTLRDEGNPIKGPATATLTVIAVEDSDGDGVLDAVDLCPGTVIPEGVPTVRLGTNRHALVDGDGIFDTTPPNGNGPGDVFTIFDTGGCSCEQIIEARGLGEGHRKFGCSLGAMRTWVGVVDFAFNGSFADGFESGDASNWSFHN